MKGHPKNLKDCSFVGVNENAFTLITHFRKCAWKEGWSEKEIQEVLDDAMDGDYDHPVVTLAARCEGGGG